eukprot:RCo038758
MAALRRIISSVPVQTRPCAHIFVLFFLTPVMTSEGDVHTLSMKRPLVRPPLSDGEEPILKQQRLFPIFTASRSDLASPCGGVAEIEDLVPHSSSRSACKGPARKATRPAIISASRRTDIPHAFLSPFLRSCVDGVITYTNPISKAPVHVALDRNQIYVFWSKNYGRFLSQWAENAEVCSPSAERTVRMQELFRASRLFFQFTINSECVDLEPRVAPLKERLCQLRQLVDLFGASHVLLRFDPIVHYINQAGCRTDNLTDFEAILDAAQHAGIREVTFSFCIGSPTYTRVAQRFNRRGLSLFSLSVEQRKEVLDRLLGQAHARGITLLVCSDSQWVGYEGRLGGVVGAGACVNGAMMCRVVQENERGTKAPPLAVSFKKDNGQRKQCNCTESRDVGEYSWRCPHGCVYCYANPAD